MRRRSLEELEQAVQTLRPHPDPSIRSLARDLLNWIEDGAEGSLDAALGLTAPGIRLAQRVAVSRRNPLLRAAAATLPAGLSAGARAERMGLELSRYYRGEWRHDKERAENPHDPDSLRGLLWSALKIKDHDIGVSSMKKILRSSD